MPQRNCEGSGPIHPVGVVSSRGIRRREAGVPQIHWAHEDALEEPNAADIMGCTDRTARDHRVNSVWL